MGITFTQIEPKDQQILEKRIDITGRHVCINKARRIRNPVAYRLWS
jgi:hypothetical protein